MQRGKIGCESLALANPRQAVRRVAWKSVESHSFTSKRGVCRWTSAIRALVRTGDKPARFDRSPQGCHPAKASRRLPTLLILSIWNQGAFRFRTATVKHGKRHYYCVCHVLHSLTPPLLPCSVLSAKKNFQGPRVIALLAPVPQGVRARVVMGRSLSHNAERDKNSY